MATASWKPRIQKTGMQATLIDGAAGLLSGGWVSLDGTHPATITIEPKPGTGAFIATLEVRVSNAPERPSDTEDGAPFPGGTDITTPQTVAVDAPFNHVKVNVTAHVSGRPSAYLRT